MWYRHRGQPGHSMHSCISSAQVWIVEIVEFIGMLLVDETCAQGFSMLHWFSFSAWPSWDRTNHLTWRRRPFWTGNQLLCAWFCLRQKCRTGSNFMSILSDGSDFLSRSHSANDFADATLIDLSSGSQRHPFRHWWVHHGTDTIWTGCVLRCSSEVNVAHLYLVKMRSNSRCFGMCFSFETIEHQTRCHSGLTVGFVYEPWIFHSQEIGW